MGSIATSNIRNIVLLGHGGAGKTSLAEVMLFTNGATTRLGIVPSEVMGDISGRRGRVTGMVPKGKKTIINATCPMAEVQRYAPELKGMSAGKGAFTMWLSGYEEVPAHLVDKIVSASPFKKDDDE